MTKGEGSVLWNLIQLVVTLAIFGGFVYAVKLILAAFNTAVTSTKDTLAHQGVNISSKGVAVKTDKRQVTAEETADKMRSGIMKGWKSSSFKVPSSLAHASNLAGSTHDKDKTTWEAKHGPKKHKNHVE